MQDPFLPFKNLTLSTSTLSLPSLLRAEVIERLLPREIVDLVIEYAHGKCAYFALALADMSNNEELCGFANEEDIVKHFAVISNDKLFDAYGKTTVKEIQKRYYKYKLRAFRFHKEYVRTTLEKHWLEEKDAAIVAVNKLAKYHGWKRN